MPAVEIIEVGSDNQIDVENFLLKNVQSELSLGQNKHNEVNTIGGSFEKFDDESASINPAEGLEKEEDQESTLLNRA